MDTKKEANEKKRKKKLTHKDGETKKKKKEKIKKNISEALTIELKRSVGWGRKKMIKNGTR